ncbi:MAG: large subunit ribosomal protein L13 [Candidatus Midichloriaceae bacterium]|jgi:large subunit ribosomal protein L13
MSKTLSGTYFANPADVKKDWLLVDANNQVLGRLASQIAKVLRGKHKCYYTPHIDTGDNIVVINAEKIKLTGKKLKQKIYYRHTGYPGGLKERTAFDILSSNRPEELLQLAVKRMMPKESPLARKQLKNLHVYVGEIHAHDAQKPKTINLTK